MSAKNECVNEGDQNGSSEAVEAGVGAALEIASHLASTARGPDGKLKPEARIQLALRSAEGRRELLEELLLEVCPDGVDEALWLSWLQGGRTPFDKDLKKVDPGTEGPSRSLFRNTPRLRSQEKKVERLRADLEREEKELQSVRAFENAAVHWHVVDQLVGIISPVFAMGPGWTILRALSAHLPDEVARDATDALYGKEKDIIIGRMRAERAAETDQIFKTLDYLSGIAEFEEALRAAVATVVKEYGAKGESLVKDGRRPRSKEAFEVEAHPKAQKESNEVLDGLRPAALGAAV